MRQKNCNLFALQIKFQYEFLIVYLYNFNAFRSVLKKLQMLSVKKISIS